jgi:hypothetical protein
MTHLPANHERRIDLEGRPFEKSDGGVETLNAQNRLRVNALYALLQTTRSWRRCNGSSQPSPCSAIISFRPVSTALFCYASSSREGDGRRKSVNAVSASILSAATPLHLRMSM